MARQTFYDIQKREKWKSLVFLLPLFVFYLIPIVFLYFFVKFLFLCSIILEAEPEVIKKLWTIGWQDWLWVVTISVGIAICHWVYARNMGTRDILNQLSARKPDRLDRYHKQFENIVKEMQISSDLPKVKAYVLPSIAYNSLALLDKNDVPVVAVTEGVVSDFKREEIQAVVAHELAHLIRGDAFFIGLISALIGFYYTISDKIMPEERGRTGEEDGDLGDPPRIAYAVLLRISALMMRLFSCFVSRKRELLADATAVEITRNPFALARAIDRAHRGLSMISGATSGYSPIFIVSPYSKGIDQNEGFWASLFSTHPPPRRREAQLLIMAKKTFKDLTIMNEASRRILDPSENAEAIKQNDSIVDHRWLVLNDTKHWIGPFSMADLVAQSWFSLSMPVRLVEGNTDRYRIPSEYLKRGVRAKYLVPLVQMFADFQGGRNLDSRNVKCPSCGVPLKSGFYEGVRIRPCDSCGGRLVSQKTLDRILIRNEVGFSDRFIIKARQWAEKVRRHYQSHPSRQSQMWCPGCGMPMRRRMYSLAIAVEVEACDVCQILWFDKDELEILQILVEEAVKQMEA